MTVRDVVKRALRIPGVLGAGRDPDATDAADALSAYNTMVRAMFGHGIGLALKGARLSTSADADNGTLYWAGTAAATLTLPELPLDGYRFGVTDTKAALATYPVTVNPNDLLIEGAAANLTLNTNGTAKSWFFRADTANWERERDLTLNDEPYFPTDLHEPLAYMLAERLAGEFGAQLAPADVAAAQQGKDRFSQRYGPRGTIASDVGLTAGMPSVRFRGGIWPV